VAEELGVEMAVELALTEDTTIISIDLPCSPFGGRQA